MNTLFINTFIKNAIKHAIKNAINHVMINLSHGLSYKTVRFCEIYNISIKIINWINENEGFGATQSVQAVEQLFYNLTMHSNATCCESVAIVTVCQFAKYLKMCPR